MSRVRPEALVAEEMRNWLLMQLPAKVATINAARAPVLTSPYAGPWTIAAGMKLRVSISDQATFTDVALTAGAGRTATNLAADVNGTGGLSGVGSADADGRLLLTGTAPTSAEQLVMVKDGLGVGDAETGAAPLLGWNPGGEKAVRYPLSAPLGTGVCDGWPVILDCGPGFWVIIGKRVGVPVQPGDIRRDSHQVGLELTILLKDTNRQNSRSREAIEACVQCVREVLLTDRGRYIGRNGSGDVMKVEEKNCIIPGAPWRASDENGAVLGIFDTATYSVSVRVYARPDAT